jgi:murein DD-endopeptidase MepM/ murein hydrolase activator NlpD
VNRDGVLVLLGLGILMVAASGPEWGDASLWAWPIPDLVITGTTFPAEMSQEWRRIVPAHLGVDFMYRRPLSPLTDVIKSERFNDHGDNARWFTPPNTPILAARAGTVYSVDRSPRGIEVVLDHGPPWATYYQHLSSVSVKKGDAVAAGQQIGVIGADPTDPEGLRHLHFATWYKGAGDSASVDPGRVVPLWRRTSWTEGT